MTESLRVRESTSSLQLQSAEGPSEALKEPLPDLFRWERSLWRRLRHGFRNPKILNPEPQTRSFTASLNPKPETLNPRAFCSKSPATAVVTAGLKWPLGLRSL